jgi:hypothetical protein
MAETMGEIVAEICKRQRQETEKMVQTGALVSMAET